MRGGIHRDVARVLEVQGRFDLLALLRGGGQEDEIDVLTARRLGRDCAADSILQALGAAFALAQLEQVGDLLGQGHRLIDVLGCEQGATLGFPVLAERFEDAVAPFATRYQGYCADHAVGVRATRYFAGFVFSGQAELEQLGRAALAGVAIVQGQGGDWQLRVGSELLHQRLFQGADHQLHASGLGLAIEIIQGGQARAVEYFNGWRLLSGLLGLEVCSHEAVTQGAGNTGQLAFLGQQQGNFVQRLAGQLLELDQWQRQLQCRRMIGVLAAPGVDRSLLLLQGAGAFHGQGQAGPARQGVGAGADALQLFAGQCGDQVPDRILVAAGRVAAEQGSELHAHLGGFEGLAVGFQDAGLDAAGAYLLVFWQFAQACHARVAQGRERCLGLVAAHGQFGAQGAGKNLLGGFELIDGNLLKNTCSLNVVFLSVSQVGGAQAQQGGLFRCLAGGGLFKQLLDAGVRGARQFAEARRGRAGAGCQQGGEAKGCEQPQASDHVRVLLLDQINWQLYPSTGRGAILLA
ncbi:hypothetical protein D3C77_67400 [compost metagenome]